MTAMGGAAWWLNLATFLGIAILAVPVLSLNNRKRRLQRIRDLDRDELDNGSFRAKVRALSQDKWRENVEGWRKADQLCLFAGYALLLGASFLRLVL